LRIIIQYSPVVRGFSIEGVSAIGDASERNGVAEMRRSTGRALGVEWSRALVTAAIAGQTHSILLVRDVLAGTLRDALRAVHIKTRITGLFIAESDR
jgi:hypothetical protein